jgi:hypothetical protein
MSGPMLPSIKSNSTKPLGPDDIVEPEPEPEPDDEQARSGAVMTARIMIDLDLVHPVSGGRWHRVAHLYRLPQPGEPITMLCGQVEEAEYVSAEQTVIVSTCWSCALAYRRQQGIPVPPTPGPGWATAGSAGTDATPRIGAAVIERDRELLAKVARVNGRIGEVVLELFRFQDGGELPSAGVRELGQALSEVGADLLTRAAEPVARCIDAPP